MLPDTILAEKYLDQNNNIYPTMTSLYHSICVAVATVIIVLK